MSYQNVKNYRIRLKERAVYVMGGKCSVCGYNKCQTALEFHHLNPEEKDFTFAANTNRAWSTIRKELEKCILVCANCHREIHSGMINTINFLSNFNENKAKEIDELVEQVKTKQISYCKYCGIEVYQGNNCCPKCAAIKSRVVERPSRDELKYLIRTTSFVKIGEKFGVSDNAIRKWCETYNLPRKKTDINQYTDEQWELL